MPVLRTPLLVKDEADATQFQVLAGSVEVRPEAALRVEGAAKLLGDARLEGAVLAERSVTALEGLRSEGPLRSEGAATFFGDFRVEAPAKFVDSLRADTTLVVGGASELVGNVAARGDLAVTGSACLSSGLGTAADPVPRAYVDTLVPALDPLVGAGAPSGYVALNAAVGAVSATPTWPAAGFATLLAAVSVPTFVLQVAGVADIGGDVVVGVERSGATRGVASDTLGPSGLLDLDLTTSGSLAGFQGGVALLPGDSLVAWTGGSLTDVRVVGASGAYDPERALPLESLMSPVGFAPGTPLTYAVPAGARRARPFLTPAFVGDTSGVGRTLTLTVNGSAFGSATVDVGAEPAAAPKLAGFAALAPGDALAVTPSGSGAECLLQLYVEYD